ncbi:MAG: hypothetical protein RLZZ487_594 [Pseudomonadota bacterium]
MFSRIHSDIQCILDRDPAARTSWEVLTCYPGLHAVVLHRWAHACWRAGFKWLGRFISNFSRWVTGIEIHPGAKLGERVFFDHGMGIVIGETAVVGNNVSMLHNVTLGGTGKEGGDRHPKIGAGVLIGAGAKILGNIKVGEGARIASGSVVLHEVAPGCTVAGIPARPVGGPCCENPADSMDQVFDVATFDPGL